MSKYLIAAAVLAFAAVLVLLGSPVWSQTVTPGSQSPVYTLTMGNDTFILQPPGGKVVGRAGNDWIVGLGGNNTLIGSAGNDTLMGRNASSGISVMTGGPGNDKIFCNGQCRAYGQWDNDFLRAKPAPGAPEFDNTSRLAGGPGRDTFATWLTADFSYAVQIVDMTPEDFLAFRLTSAAGTLSGPQIFALLDSNHDGVWDIQDNGAAYQQYRLLVSQHTSTFPGTIELVTGYLGYFTLIAGVDRIVAAQMVEFP